MTPTKDDVGELPIPEASPASTTLHLVALSYFAWKKKKKKLHYRILISTKKKTNTH